MFNPIGLSLPALDPDKASLPSQLPERDLPAAREPDGRAVMFDRAVDRDLADRLIGERDVNGRAVVLRRPMTGEERTLIEGRRAALQQTLAPYDYDQRALVEAEVAAMLSGFRAMRQHGDDALAMIEVTCAVLREFPLWAIAKACRLIVTRKARVEGRRLDERFAPNDSEIHAVVEEEVRLHRRALDQAEALLNATVALPQPERKPVGRQVTAALPRDDGNHLQRVRDDLAMRKACKAEGFIGA